MSSSHHAVPRTGRRARARLAIVVLLLVTACTLGDSALAGATASTGNALHPKVVNAKVVNAKVVNTTAVKQAPGWVTTRTKAGTLSVAPATKATAAELRAFAAASACGDAVPCLSAGNNVYVGVVCVPGTSCQVESTVYKRAFVACASAEAGFVHECMSGTIVWAVWYAACNTACRLAGQYGTHFCQTTGSRGILWSVDSTGCSSSYLASHASVVREEFKACYLKLNLCDTFAYHVNAYNTGAITGPYGGPGSII